MGGGSWPSRQHVPRGRARPQFLRVGESRPPLGVMVTPGPLGIRIPPTSRSSAEPARLAGSRASLAITIFARAAESQSVRRQHTESAS